MIALVQIDHRETVGGRRDRVPPSELGARRTVGDRLPDQLAGIGARLQQADRVAGDLAPVVALDAAPQTRDELRALLGGIGPPDGDRHAATVIDVDTVGLDVLLAEDARPVAHPELPVVPRTRDDVTVEVALRHAVPLVRAGVVDRVNATRRPHDADALPIDLDHLHRALAQIGEMGDRLMSDVRHGQVP